MRHVRTSKLLSLVLRHRAATIGLTLDSAGWIRIDQLVKAMAMHGHPGSEHRVLGDLVAEPSGFAN